MKKIVKISSLLVCSVLYFSACTFGDKGKEKKPNTVDTTVHTSPAEGATGNGVNPANAVNSGHPTTNGDTVNTDSVEQSGNRQ